ncbi:MAG: type IV-A pilus assembly ATPase PilB [candidate division Zixibacteria bacterium 4484_93]|nr:MAG: type IV-A pilus assembly ATPase PilB [candidate division Zixibacteria bacterium 4484_93]
MMALKIGEMLVKAGRITEEELKTALDRQKETGQKLGQVLLELGFIEDENVISEFLAKQLNIGTVKLSDMELDPEIISLIPAEIAKKFGVIPTLKIGKILFIATSDPTNVYVLDTLKFVTGLDVQPLVSSKNAIQDAINKYYEEEHSLDDIISEMNVDYEEIEVLDETEDFTEQEIEKAVQEKPLVRLVDGIILEAIRQKASDIHIEPYEKVVRVRYRVDGVLHEMTPIPSKLRHAVVSRVKIMSKLNISERRRPQDGRIKINAGGRPVDLRVSVLPCMFGEKVVMRILDPQTLMLDMTKLGFPERSLKLFQQAIHLPYGMILVTGPTGSGKTTTLYSALSTLNKPMVNIMTSEDPVEFNIEGINQVQVHPDIGLTFAAALRSFLRQDPDIIMVGEIRDFETADIAIKAALTGHLVFSTLHTNDAPSTITRLVDMGVQPFLVASSVKLVMAQRLLKTICPKCKEETEISPEEIELLGLTDEDVKNTKFYKGAGCDLCGGTGYKGRTGVFEVMPITKTIEHMIIEGASALELQEQACKEGMATLRAEALEKLKSGIVTAEQVIATTMS